MKLSKVEIREFQSIRQSNPFSTGDITCLVGKNEAGKTAILQALYRLNPIIPSDGKYDVTTHYPRAEVEDYQQNIEKGDREPAKVAFATFILDQSDIEPIDNEFGKGTVVEPELQLSKGYDNTLDFKLKIDERKVILSLIDQAQVPNELADELSKASSMDQVINIAESMRNEDSEQHISRFMNEVSRITASGSIEKFIFQNHLENIIPKFFYFDEYYVLKGQENLEALRNRVNQNNPQKSDYPLLGLIELARLDINQLLNTQQTEKLVNKLEGASNHLSKKILKYWSQNRHLQLRFDVRPGMSGDLEGMRSGTNLWTRVYDSKHQVTTLLGTRSRGFVWFFSFLAWYDKLQRNNDRIILLLDEPGLFLHGKAQMDLLKYMEEELKENHQVIYTTHSPFMVDSKKFDRVRVVQDKSMDTAIELSTDEEGTKVFTDVLEASQDSLFPLQGALGYEIHQSLFVGPYNLIVEGVSDLLYLQTISGILERKGAVGLSHNWVIVPVGGADKVPMFVSLLGSQKGLTIATLIDFQKKDQQLIQNLYKRKLLKQQNVLTFADFTEKQEADIEDMFSLNFYLTLVNKEFVEDLEKPISEKEITGKSPRILICLEEYFKNNPLRNGKKFSHYRPARYFSEKVGELESSIPEETLHCFELIFKKLNALL